MYLKGECWLDEIQEIQTRLANHFDSFWEQISGQPNEIGPSNESLEQIVDMFEYR